MQLSIASNNPMETGFIAFLNKLMLYVTGNIFRVVRKGVEDPLKKAFYNIVKHSMD